MSTFATALVTTGDSLLDGARCGQGREPVRHTFGTYVYRPLARPLGIAAVIALTIVNYRGVEKTARLTRVIVTVVLGALAAVVLSVLTGEGTSVSNLGPEKRLVSLV